MGFTTYDQWMKDTDIGQPRSNNLLRLDSVLKELNDKAYVGTLVRLEFLQLQDALFAWKKTEVGITGKWQSSPHNHNKAVDKLQAWVDANDVDELTRQSDVDFAKGISPGEQDQFERHLARLELEVTGELIRSRSVLDTHVPAYLSDRKSQLLWDDRESFNLRGKAKSVAQAGLPTAVDLAGGVATGVAGAFAPAVAPVAYGATKAASAAVKGYIAGTRRQKTVNVIAALENLTSLSEEAQDDVEYILKNKHAKVDKVDAALAGAVVDVVAGVPAAAIAVTGATVYGNIEKRLKEGDEHIGEERRKRATRILDGIRRNPIDKSCLAIVDALFTNRPDKIDIIKNLATNSDKKLCVNVVMGKIASR